MELRGDLSHLHDFRCLRKAASVRLQYAVAVDTGGERQAGGLRTKRAKDAVRERRLSSSSHTPFDLMGLDSNLFTLGIQPRAGQPGWVDLFSDGNIDTLAQPAYAAYKAPGEENDQLQLYGACKLTQPRCSRAHQPPQIRSATSCTPPSRRSRRSSKSSRWTLRPPWWR